MKTQQISEDGIRHLVNAFYAKVRVDPELAPIFERAILGDWDLHLVTMYDFWSSVMLISGRYKGNPVEKHLQLKASNRYFSTAGCSSSGKLVMKSSMTTSQPIFAPRRDASLRA